jgi:hypothetical protein
VTHDDGTEEVAEAGSVDHMRPGHSPRFDVETTMVEVSPEQEMRHVLGRVAEALAGRASKRAV